MLKQQIYQHILKTTSENENFKKWFDPLDISSINEGSILVTFPHIFFSDWFEQNFKQYFENICLDTFPGHIIEFTYICASDKKNFKYSENKKNNELSEARKEETSKECSSEKIKKIDDEKEYSFDSFVFNAKNEFPVAVVKEFATGNSSCQLLVIHAASGCGKTHILHSMYNIFKINVPKKYLHFSDLSYLVTLISNNGALSEQKADNFFKNKVVLLDNFQNIPQNKSFQNFLTSLIDAFYTQNKPIVISMDRPPASCSFLNDKLRSRLESGLIIEFKKPDIDVLRQYVENQAEVFGLEINKSDTLSLANRYNEFRQIQGALRKAATFQSLYKKDNSNGTTNALKQILKNAGKEEKQLSMEDIIKKVAAYFELESQDITGKNRMQGVVFARQIAMHLCRDLLDAPLVEIGNAFGGKDHSSVLYSINKIKSLSKSNKDMNILFSDIKNLCLNKSSLKNTVRNKNMLE